MGTKNDPGKFDCYAAAGPDEPIFVLRAHDALAPAVVLFWAQLRRFDKPGDEKIEEAIACARSMEAWRRSEGGEEEQSAPISAGEWKQFELAADMAADKFIELAYDE